jgi:hypothetical protein
VEIRGPLPFRIANAYGVKPRAAPPASAAEPSQRLAHLVAGRVALPANPALASTAAGPAGDAFQMYTRAADRVDVATRLALGRSLDTTA